MTKKKVNIKDELTKIRDDILSDTFVVEIKKLLKISTNDATVKYWLENDLLYYFCKFEIGNKTTLFKNLKESKKLIAKIKEGTNSIINIFGYREIIAYRKNTGFSLPTDEELKIDTKKTFKRINNSQIEDLITSQAIAPYHNLYKQSEFFGEYASGNTNFLFIKPEFSLIPLNFFKFLDFQLDKINVTIDFLSLNEKNYKTKIPEQDDYIFNELVIRIFNLYIHLTNANPKISKVGNVYKFNPTILAKFCYLVFNKFQNLFSQKRNLSDSRLYQIYKLGDPYKKKYGIFPPIWKLGDFSSQKNTSQQDK